MGHSRKTIDAGDASIAVWNDNIDSRGILPDQIVECVPNVSEGRNPDVLQAICAAIRTVPEVLLLGEERDEDHNRAVITFAGAPDAVLEAALRCAEVAVSRIDLTAHRGVHPRIGALDVLPFIPVSGITMAECVAIAREAAQQIWKRCGVPCYLYESAAQRPERRNLESFRRGQFEYLRDALPGNSALWPDVGGPELHPTAGASAVGARKFLIAWNVWLKTEDVTVAREIAALIRQSSGGFPFVKALGLPLASRSLTQVSMNLTDFEETPPQAVFDAIVSESAKRGIEVVGSELIGFVPNSALEVNFRESLRMLNFSHDSILENRIATLRNRENSGDSSTRIAGSTRGGLKKQGAPAQDENARCGVGLAQRAIELLLEATCIGSARTEGALTISTFDWNRETQECRGLEEMLFHAELNTERNQAMAGLPRSSLRETIVSIAEKAVWLQTRIASERGREREDPPDVSVAAGSATIRHLLGASLGLAVLAALEVASTMTPDDAVVYRARLQPLEELVSAAQ